MSNLDGAQRQGISRPNQLLRLLIVLPAAIFIAEIVAMILIVFYKGPYWISSLLDATIMIILIFPVVYFFSYRPLLQQISHTEQAEQALQEQYTELLAETTVRRRAENIMQARLRLMQFAPTHTLDELLQTTIDEISTLTESQIGFFHFLELNQNTLLLQSWSTNTLQNMCTADGKGSHYPIEQAGVWADCVRQRKPIIHNDYNSLPGRKGTPEGHAPILRELTVPIIRNEKVVGIFGVGNKLQDYTTNDMELVSTLADFAWDTIERKRAEDALIESEHKFHTLLDWTYDWEIWMDPQDRIVYSSPACERITGYRPDELIASPSLLKSMLHPEDQGSFEEHCAHAHGQGSGTIQVEYRILARDGSEYWIEHICRPIIGGEGNYLGRRVSNRDITDRKRTDQTLRERAQKELMLTRTIHTMKIDIARDLHDTLGQNIGYLRMRLEHLSEKGLNKKAEIKTEFQSLSKVANESYDLMRGTLAVLQAENSVDLFYLFSRYSKQVAERSELIIDFETQGKPRALSANQMRQLFYIFRETLSNIEKHAAASQVQVQIVWDDSSLALIIFDNGKGFNLDQMQHPDGHYGLKFMRERTKLMNGSFSIQTHPGNGTKVIVHIPNI
jgi:PAS domain S-box-containing protein